MTAFAGTELEFIVFRDTYEQAWNAGYRDLTPANQYNVDYSVLGTARIEPLLRDIRNDMTGAGLAVESAKGECNLGQHEIGFLYDEALTTADNHVIYKNGAKEIAAQEGMALTFMAKFDAREGNSCHIHLPLRGARRRDGVLAATGTDVRARRLVRRRPAATMREFTLLFAPNINSYKRFAEGSFAPTAMRWGATTAPAPSGWSATGRRAGWRTASPAATSTPTWPLAAMSPAGCTASRRSSSSEPAFEGNAYDDRTADGAGTPARGPGPVARPRSRARTFGDDVVDHYANMAAVELAAFEPRSPTGSGSGGSSGCERATMSTLRRRQPGHRRGRHHRPARGRWRRPTPPWRGPSGRSSPGGESRRPTARGCCAGSPSWSTPTSRSSPSSRCATPATRSATPAGRPATSATS